MAITRSKKQSIFDSLTGDIAKQKAVVLLTTKGSEVSLTASSNYELRKQARAKGLKLQVIKNTLINKAFEEVPTLNGVTFLAYMVDGSSTDEVTVPKAMVDLVTKEFKTQMTVLGSVVNGEFFDKAKTIQLSKVSTKDESIAKIAGSLNQITAKIAIAVKEVPASIARGLNAYQKTM
jgi:large subunit ribosomal protein L10